MLSEPVLSAPPAGAGQADRAGGAPRPWYERGTLPRRVGVVIPTRNRADSLPHMLGSLMLQSHPAERILVVDDGGNDATADVVRRYPGVEYLRAAVGDGSSGNPARNVGLSELRELPYLCFLDDDDMVPPDYLERLLATIETDCRAAAAYPRLRFCGKFPRVWDHPWDPAALGRSNLAGVPALIRTDALLQVGGWPTFPADPAGRVPHDDWALWRRLRDHGWRMVPAAVEYFYHRHGGGVCESKARANHRTEWKLTVDPTNLVTLAIPWSGREAVVEDVLDAVAAQTFPAEHLHVLFYDNSGSAGFGRRLRRWLADHEGYASTAYVRDARPAVEGRSAVEVADAPLDDRCLGRRRFGPMLNHRVGAIWNRLGRLVHTDLIWCLEDDVIPPAQALDRLLEHVNAEVDGVTACYPSRVVPGRCVAWDYTDVRSGTVVHLARGEGVRPIGGCGLGCVLVRRDVFQAGPARSAGESVGYDCNLWLDVARRGGTLLVDWDLVCEHRIAPHVAITAPEGTPAADPVPCRMEV